MKKLELVHTIDDIFNLVDSTPNWSKELKEKAVERQKNLLKPADSLGQLEDLSLIHI